MERMLSVTISLIIFLYAVEVVSFAFGHPLCSSHDSLALLQFKHSLVMADYPLCSSDYPYIYDVLFHCQSSVPKMTSWNRSSMDCCTWNGVTCDSLTGHVIGLDLSFSKLEGTIHPNSSLFQLQHLQKLDLSINNFLESHIPQSIVQLVRLTHLNLSYCYLEGRIPLEISYMSNLVSLDLSNFASNVQLSGEGFNMLFQNLTKLEVLSLSYVNISSKIPMNVSFSSSLRYLDLGYTYLQGDLPKSIFLLPNLETLKLWQNDLAISLPKFNWSSSHMLTELDLSHNNISGGLPSSLGSLKGLKLLHFSGCNLIGPIPEFVWNLSQITHLYLSGNQLEGKIPDAFSNFQKLTQLGLDQNNFTGPFPSSLVNLTKLEVLHLWDNSLSGPLPFTASGLQNLSELDLFENTLNGSIPSWMLSLPSLRVLYLGHNHFGGPLPEFKTNSLEILDISNNQLSGPIPHSLRDLVNLTDLLLGSNNLSGEVGAQMFSTMKNLGYLDLSHSGLSWSSNKENINTTLPSLYYLSLGFCRLKDFPNFLLNSKQLEYLDLSENEIHGQLPKWFGGLSSLQEFNLSHNYLTSLDHLPWQTMRVVDLHSNSLRGPLPSSLCEPNSLDILILSHNNLSAEIPNCLFISKTLRVLDLRGNNLRGPIPNIFLGCGELNYIGLSKNQLEGPIPRSLVNCTSLQVLDLGNNKIHDIFPIWLERLQELEVLILKSNRFHGPISASQTKLPFPNLRIFDLSVNSFTGSLPKKILKGFKAMMNMDAHKSGPEYMGAYYYGNFTTHYYESVTLVMKNQETEFKKILTIFTIIDLSRNKFEGEIPKFIGNLNSLRLLNLSRNNLTGHIPVGMRNMSTLEALDLSFNRLTGKIPMELASLTFLVVLNLSYNHLVGPIPHSNQFNTFPNDSYFGNSDLCGFPLSNECGQRKSASVPVLSVEQEVDEASFLSEMTWQSVLIGYGCGLVFGFTILYLIYKFEKPRWFIDLFATITHEMTYRAKRRSQRHRNFRRTRQ
ncbi:receptor-like protein Cf-9 homolog [Lycium barbarum]|uniref:receptor-like protein Cf-9 homolog n=1 Tax=Lycium barbarum TaxID=112863 RepID=UPI00293E8A15|nr:receptor-like protein Cf-9 homolog [Lycium barbarum]